MNADSDCNRPVGFEPIEHTADVGLRIWGRTMKELFEQAGLGLMTLLVDLATVETTESRLVSVEAIDLEEALIAWLQELIYLYEVERFVTREISMETVTSEIVMARVRGELFDGDRHDARTDIKAATYHDLHIRRKGFGTTADQWECTIIFDT